MADDNRKNYAPSPRLLAAFDTRVAPRPSLWVRLKGRMPVWLSRGIGKHRRSWYFWLRLPGHHACVTYGDTPFEAAWQMWKLRTEIKNSRRTGA